MIIFIFNIKDIPVLYLECNSPISTYFDRPSSFTIPLEWMKAHPWQVHIFKFFSCFKKSENLSDPSRILRIYTTCDTGFE